MTQRQRKMSMGTNNKWKRISECVITVDSTYQKKRRISETMLSLLAINRSTVSF